MRHCLTEKKKHNKSKVRLLRNRPFEPKKRKVKSQGLWCAHAVGCDT